MFKSLFKKLFGNDRSRESISSGRTVSENCQPEFLKPGPITGDITFNCNGTTRWTIPAGGGVILSTTSGSCGPLYDFREPEESPIESRVRKILEDREDIYEEKD